MYQSTTLGVSVRPRAPPNAVPFHPAGDQLERPGGDLLTRLGDADDDAFAPAAVAGFQRLAHDRRVARGVEGVVGPAAGQLHQVGHQVFVAQPVGVDEVGHAELAAPLLALGIDVDADDHPGAHHPQALDNVEADAAQAEDDAVGARLHIGRVDHRAHAGGDAAAHVAGAVEWRVLADLGHRDLGQDGVVRERRAAHVVVDRLALVREPAGAVGHQPLALCRADRSAQVGLAAEAAFALPAFRRVERDHVVADRDTGHAGPDFHDHARALVAQDRREQPFGVQAVQRVGIGVADARGLDLDQHLSGARTFEVHLHDLQRLLGLEGHGGARLHRNFPRLVRRRAPFPKRTGM
jgi:hypothetical protein